MVDDRLNKDYMFGYDYRASARLDLQHFLIQQQIGHSLHPSIKLPKENSKIADIGAGTCIWSVECSLQLNPSTQLDCFDITPAQYPAKEWLPENVSLNIHDAFTPFPSEFHGKYDLVNIRFFQCIVQHDDPSTLIENLAALLKPQGFIQWVEADGTSLRMISPRDPSKSSNAVQKIHDFMASPRPNLRFNWVPTLDTHLERAGMMNVKLEKYSMMPFLESFHNRLKLLACEEAFSLMPANEETQQLRESLGQAYAEMRDNGAGFTSGFVLALGMKQRQGETARQKCLV